MAEVLSQNQIDALLNAVRSGDKNLENQENQAPEKKYRKYDFYSPRKFTKDRLKMIRGIFDNYTRLINSRINALLRTSCEITVDSVEEQRYHEFSNALTENDVLSLAHMEIQNKRDENQMLLYMTAPIMLSMMDRMMGGEGNIDESLLVDYSFTDMELKLYESIISDIVSPLGSSWESYIKLECEYDGVEVNPTLVQLIGLDETVVIIDLKLQFTNMEGRLSVCMPGMLLTNIFAAINREGIGRRVVGEDNSEEIFGSLRDSDLEIVAELGKTQLLLSDIYHLNVGDVIDLSQPKETPIQLKIGGRKWFDGRMGIFNKNVAVKIGESYYQEERGSV